MTVAPGFTAIPLDVVHDRGLSRRAVGLLTFMLSFPDDTEFDVDMLVRNAREGREAVRRALADLEAGGYIAWRSEQVDQPNGGTLTRRTFDVYDKRGAAPASDPRPRRSLTTVTLEPGAEMAGRFEDNTELPRAGFFVYRLYGHDGALLYIGRTTQPRSRFKAHVRVWAELLVRWELTAYATHDEMCRVEVAEIQRHRPALNRGR